MSSIPPRNLNDCLPCSSNSTRNNSSLTGIPSRRTSISNSFQQSSRVCSTQSVHHRNSPTLTNLGRTDPTFFKFSSSSSSPPTTSHLSSSSKLTEEQCATYPFGIVPKSVAKKRLLTELKDLEEFPLEHCNAGPSEETSIFHWMAVVEGPPDTVYSGGTFFVQMNFTDNYPFVPPELSIRTPIYHWNVDLSGEILLDNIYTHVHRQQNSGRNNETTKNLTPVLLSRKEPLKIMPIKTDGWTSTMSIGTILRSILSMMRFDPWTLPPGSSEVSGSILLENMTFQPEIARQFLDNRPEFDRIARIWTQRFAA